MNKNQFLEFLEMLKNGKLEKVERVSKYKPFNLTPNYPYLFYDIETEFSGRKVYNNVHITAGYYNPKPYDDPYNSAIDENEVVLVNAISLKYSTRDDDIQPFDDIQEYDLDLDEEDEEEETYFTITAYTTVYKLPLPPIDSERVTGMKEVFEEMRYVPENSDNISFIGEKYREAKQNFEKNQKLTGGKKKISRKSKTKKTSRKGKSKKRSRKHNYRR